MKNKDLYICNSVYQLLVCLWIKHRVNPQIPGDLIVSNHMNNGRELAEQARAENCFGQVYFVESFDYARYRTPSSRMTRYEEELFPQRVLSRFWDGRDAYSTVYLANPDRFSQLLFNALSRRNPALQAVLYEDGMLTYSPIFQSDVESSRIELVSLPKKLVYRHLFRRKALCDHFRELLLFHPKDLGWQPAFSVTELEKINCQDAAFREMCNRIFQYSPSDVYDRKYLFMEESFAAEGVPINDVQLLNQLAQRVGKENIMVKIHPRNPVNRFAADGFKTNQNTSIPWELIVMNLGDISDMTLITVASSSVLNPMMIFGKKVKAYSLYHLVDKSASKSRLLTGPFWNTVHKAFLENADMITICDSINDIE